ncbi:hypothetical protein ABFX02_14G176600 [Erythranthe guttata]
MGVELLKIETKMKKFPIKVCFRSVCSHPFLVCMLCFLIFIHRSFPFVFSLFVSASPVLICTAILLGTLLSFGQLNVHKLERDETTTADEVVPLETGLSKSDAVVVEENNNNYYVDKTEEEEEEDSSKGGVKSNSDDTPPFVEVTPPVGELEGVEILTTKISDGNLETDDDEKSVADSFDSERVNVDCLDSPPHEEDGEEEVEEEEGDALDSGSDGAESSSPDASMADIMPMLDELHPLLDEEAAQNAQISSRDNSDDAMSQHSSESTTTASTVSSHQSGDETENCDDFDDDEEEEEVKEDKEEETKSAITWTEEDQKNLMDLGSSEIERNQRLENLILRRRTRKFNSMVPEINLIDLESSDPPFNVGPISTSRQNPFDFPHDSYDNYSGLPPIPGSAPSILLPRRNPFDIPFDYNATTEEKTGDGFREEPFFRRHESFNVGPSIFGQPPPNKNDAKLMRPYFVPERMVPEEESSYSSEKSDSKVSSVHEMESVCSVEDLEYRNLLEEEDAPHEPELISEMEHVSEHIGHGSQSSEEEEEEDAEEDSVEVGPVEKRDIEDHSEKESTGNPSVDEIPHKEPVYDSSPTSRKNFSSSSSSSDVHADSDSRLPHVNVKRTIIEILPKQKTLCRSDGKESLENLNPDSCGGDKISVEEAIVDKHEHGQDPSSSSDFDTRAQSEKEKCLLIPKLEKDDTIDKGKNVGSPNSEDEFQEANEKLITTPSVGGSTPLFYDIRMHDNTEYEHLDEVQVPNTPVESFESVRIIPNLNIQEVHELNHGISRNVNSPFSLEFIPTPSSTTSEESTSPAEMETILEDDDEIKEIDAPLSDLDSVGEFSSNESEKHIDYVGGEELSSSTSNDVAANSVEGADSFPKKDESAPLESNGRVVAKTTVE